MFKRKRFIEHMIIPPGVTITGNLSSAGDLDLEGEVHGHITCRRLTLTGQPVIKGSVKAETVRINGTFDGQIRAKKIALTKTARMTGDIYYEILEVELGASFEGMLAPFSKGDEQAGVSRAADGDEKEPLELTQMAMLLTASRARRTLIGKRRPLLSPSLSPNGVDSLLSQPLPTTVLATDNDKEPLELPQMVTQLTASRARRMSRVQLLL